VTAKEDGVAVKFKVATLSKFNQTFELEKEILANAEAELTAFKAAADEELIPLLREVDALLVGRNKISAKMIDGLKACKIIVRCGIGVDNIGVAAAARRNILVSNVPDYCIDEVSDHTVALLLCTARKLLHSDKSVHAGKWGVTEFSPLHRLRGQTLGIFGFGRIGRLVGEKAYPFGMRILVSDPYLTQEP
jgi:D-3-phosphoglycerate dehydrogenase